MNGSRIALPLGALLLLGGCASLQMEGNLKQAAEIASIEEPRLRWTESDRGESRRTLEELLSKRLSMDDAARIAVSHSATTQAALFDSASQSAAATQRARLPNPVFAFSRLIRRDEHGAEKEIERSLAFSIVDVLLLPSRLRMADYQQQQLRYRLAGDLVQAAAEARQAWVRAVATQQLASYAGQVKEAAETGAELARRMQAVGNYSRLQRAREQAFYADAVAQLARAQQAARAAREALVRILGLDASQAAELKLPERLPDLPGAPDDESVLARRALEERIDVRTARAEMEFLARQSGLTRITSFVDGLHIAAVRNSETGAPPQKGFEIEMPLPIFDFGDARRAEAQASYMAALHRAAAAGAHATSQVREAYGNYRTAYEIARHYRDEVVPLRKSIAEEMLLKYNGMLIGVFELLADAREQVGSVMQAIEAERDFWLAATALNATLVGRPLQGGSAPAARSASPARADEQH